MSFLQRLVLALLRGRQRLVLETVLDVLLLKPAQLLIGVGDAVERLQHFGLEFRLHRGERNGVLHIVFVVEPVDGRAVGVEALRRGARRGRGGGALGDAGGQGLGVLRLGHVDLGRLLAVGAGVGRLQIDDVAQQDFGFVEFVAPDDDGLEGQRAFAQARDHRLAAGLDALGDGDLALARQQFDRAHLAQIHAHGVVGALVAFRRPGGDGGGARGLDDFGAGLGLLLLGGGLGLLVGLLGLLGFDDADAHFAEHRVDVFDLIGGIDVRRQAQR